MPSIRILDSALATYNYNISLFNPVANATDVWQLQVPALCTCKVRWVEVGGNTTTARQQSVLLIRRSTKTTGGTSTTPTIAKADSSDGTPNSVVVQWTTLPGALGTAVATVDSTSFSLLTGSSIQDRAIFVYEIQSLKPITLGAQSPSQAENLSVNLNGTTLVADKLDFSIWWTEQ